MAFPELTATGTMGGGMGQETNRVNGSNNSSNHNNLSMLSSTGSHRAIASASSGSAASSSGGLPPSALSTGSHGTATSNLPGSLLLKKTPDQLRRSGLNMEKMIKKNVTMASCSRGATKRGLAVVNYFKNKQQQKEHTLEETSSTSTSSTTNSVVPATAGLNGNGGNLPLGSSSLGNALGASSSRTSSKTSSYRLQSTTTATMASSPADSNAFKTQVRTPPRRSFGSPVASTSSVSAPRVSNHAVRQLLSSSPHRAIQPDPRSHISTVTSPAIASDSRLTSAEKQRSASGNSSKLQPSPAMVDVQLSRSNVSSSTSPFESFRSKQKHANTTKTSPSMVAASRDSVSSPQQKSVPSSSSSASSTPSLHEDNDIVASDHNSASPPSTTHCMTDNGTEGGGSKTSIVASKPSPITRSMGPTQCRAPTKMKFSTEGIATSLDVSPDGECIVVGFANGAVRLYETDSSVPSDPYGYLLGHLDEQTSQRVDAMQMRVRITCDGRYVFVGCRSGLRGVMSLHLYNYRNERESEDDEDVNQLQKHFHYDAKLRGFADATKAISPISQTQPALLSSQNAYYLLSGLGVGTLHLWQFVEPANASQAPAWNYLYCINTPSHTVSVASFVPLESESMRSSERGRTLGLAAVNYQRNVRVWNLEYDEVRNNHQIKNHFDVPNSKDVEELYGVFAYGRSVVGEFYRVRIDGKGSLLARKQFELERKDPVEGIGRRARGSVTTLESLYATNDGRVVIAISEDGTLYYADEVTDGNDQVSQLKIIGSHRKTHDSSITQTRLPMRVYVPHFSGLSCCEEFSAKENAMLAVVDNPLVEETAMIKGKMIVCAASQLIGHESSSSGTNPIDLFHEEQSENNESCREKKRTLTSIHSSNRTQSVSVQRSSTGSHERERKRQKKDRSAIAVASETTINAVSPSKQRARQNPASRSQGSPAGAALGGGSSSGMVLNKEDEEEEEVEVISSPTEQISFLQQEVARYKERYDRIMTEWDRRLRGERQWRRHCKTKEIEYAEQLAKAQQEIETLRREKEVLAKQFAYDQLKSDQQAAVKQRYEKMMEQTQYKIQALDNQKRLLEKTTQSLLNTIEMNANSVKHYATSDKTECIVCKDRDAVTAIVPCGHLCFCEEDAQLYARKGSAVSKCPICQQDSLSMLRIY